MEGEILLQLKNVAVHYGGVKALDGVSVYLDEGEVVAIMGPNGAGKSTVLKSIFGLAPIVRGSVLWHEHEVKPRSYEMASRGISFVPQGRQVFKSLSVKENLEMGGFAIKSRSLLRSRIEDVLDFFPVLRDKLRVASGTLSGGQQQMLALARGLMTDPKILLLDEPSLGLAPKIVKEVFAKIKEINVSRKTAIFVVEHNIKSVLEVVDRAYVLDKGKVVVTEENPRRLLEGDLLERIFMGKL